MRSLAKIVSGGQTGVDQGALRAALQAGMESGGWCPPDCMSKRGLIPEVYSLQPTPRERSSRAPNVARSQRTEWNVFCSDATLILRPQDYKKDDPGTKWTEKCANDYGRLCRDYDPFALDSISEISQWIEQNSINWLNVAGPSEEDVNGIEQQTYDLLVEVFDRLSRTGA